MRNQQHSKFLSLVLRHQPSLIGLTLDPQGWVSIAVLLEKLNAVGRTLNRENLEELVMSNDKQRFTISADGQRIRAAQGHSIPVDLALACQKPPVILFHGTATRFLESILSEGLKPRSRQHVHLSADRSTALRVGQRHGNPVVLEIQAERMFDLGHTFYLSENGVWLTETVASEFIATRSR